MRWDRVVDHRANAGLGKSICDAVALMMANYVQMPNWITAGCDGGQNEPFDPLQFPIVICCNFCAMCVVCIQEWQLLTQKSGLQFIKALVVADDLVVIFESRAIVAQNPELIRQSVVVRCHGAGVTKCSQILSGIKTKAGRIT